MQVLNAVGAGRVGRSLARLWQQAGVVRLGGVCARRADSAADAVAFIGAGQALALDAMPPAALWLLAVPDSELAAVAGALADRIDSGTAFHASGALTASVLAPLAARGLATASAHPALSFAEPARAVREFAGTPVALEGDAAACQTLSALFAAIGGAPFPLAAAAKPGYHAACAIASNYAVVLADLALRTAQRAGLDAATARAVLAPLAGQSLANAFTLGPAAALTGPVARGDAATVALHLAGLDQVPADADAYRALGRLALQLAAPGLEPARIAAVHEALAR